MRTNRNRFLAFRLVLINKIKFNSHGKKIIKNVGARQTLALWALEKAWNFAQAGVMWGSPFVRDGRSYFS